MPPPTSKTDAAKEMYEKLTQALLGRSRCVRCCDMVIPFLRLWVGFNQICNWSSGRRTKPDQHVGCADLDLVAEAGGRHAFHQMLNRWREFLSHHARVVVIGGDLGQGLFRFGETV